jgi:tetratricopeptide (TPR) repeat protein
VSEPPERPFEVARLDELHRIPGEFDTTPVRIPLGIRAFGVNAYGNESAGGRVIEEHDELGDGAGRHEELYVVVRGRARFTLDGEDVDAPAGTLVFVRDPAVRRGAVADEPATTVLVVGATPGQAFEPSPWEAWLEAYPYYERREYGRALEVMRSALAQHPGNPNVLYNLACMESLSGERESALEHLHAALEADPSRREWAQADSDFDPIRDDPGFPR